MSLKVYKHSTLETVFYVSIGIVLCFIALKILGYLHTETHSMLGALFLGLLLPIPILIGGLYIIISTLRYKVELNDNEIIVQDGLSKTTIVKKESIKAQRLRSSGQLELNKLELKTKKSVISLNMPNSFSSDKDFQDWFEPIATSPVYKPTKGFNPGKYPKSYQPTVWQVLLRLSFCLLMFMIPVFVFFSKGISLSEIQNNKHTIWFLGIMGLYMGLFISQTCSVVVGTIAYRVTLCPQSLKIKSMLGCIEIQRDQIISCSYSGDGRSSRRWVPTLWLKVKKRKKEVIIFLALERDQLFNDWFADIKVPMMCDPLPKIDEKI